MDLSADLNQEDVSNERQQMLAKVKQAVALGKIRIELQPVDPAKTKNKIRWSPKGTKVPLEENGATLEGKLSIGKQTSFRVALTINDSTARLFIDHDRDGKFSSGEAMMVTPSVSRGKTWYSASTVIKLPFGEGDRDYPISIWYVKDPGQPEADPVLRWSRKGWHEGHFMLENQKCHVLLTDANNNGMFEKADVFGLGTNVKEMFQRKNSMYRISQHGWLDGVSFRVTDVDESGRHITIEAFDVGVTEREDREANDAYAADRKYKRSGKPLKILNDLDEALAKAKAEDKRIIVDFVTTWCGPCKMMDELVYTAKPLVEKSNDFIFVKLDGDLEKELVKRFEVSGYPTVLLLDSKGTVIQKRSGYQSVVQMLDLLGQ